MLGTLTERCITLSRSFDVEALIELLGTPRMHPSKDVLQLTVFRSSISSSETSICHYRSTAVVFDKQVATHRREFSTCLILSMFLERLRPRQVLVEEARLGVFSRRELL